MKARFIGINRLRIGTDGSGVTTLVAFSGCPLRCRYCINPQCISRSFKSFQYTPEDIMKILRKDELYFITTHGGVTWGGGEPLLYPNFIKRVLDLGAKDWHTTVETSLNVPLENLKAIHSDINSFIVDIKDMNNSIYQLYTGKNNRQVKKNLSWLIDKVSPDNIIIRVPVIKGYNIEKDIEASIFELQSLGYKKFNRFAYKTII